MFQIISKSNYGRDRTDDIQPFFSQMFLYSFCIAMWIMFIWTVRNANIQVQTSHTSCFSYKERKGVDYYGMLFLFLIANKNVTKLSQKVKAK